jgi:hypothetical protein
MAADLLENLTNQYLCQPLENCPFKMAPNLKAPAGMLSNQTIPVATNLALGLTDVYLVDIYKSLLTAYIYSSDTLS